VIQEFHISMTAVGSDRYLLRTEAVAPGVPLAETQVDLPIDAWLTQAAALTQDPLQTLLTMSTGGARLSNSRGGPGQDAPWMQLGQSLYQHIFRDRIRDSWLAAQGIAQNRRQTLRLRLGIKDSRLQRLPWEVLYGDDRPLATGNDVTFCRYFQAPNGVDLAAMPPLPQQPSPMRVLVVISAPDDQERLALRQEIQQIMQELAREVRPATTVLNGIVPTPVMADSRQIELTILEQPGRPELVQALEQGDFQVLHYAGHSNISETGGELFLVNRQTGLTDWLSGEDLAGLLVNNGIRLAIFNSCRGAFTPQDDASAGWREQNLVQALVNRGVPGVIAMAERIPDNVAITFTQLIYRNLHRGHPIDLCLSRVRQGLISAYRSDQSFWMLPILYMRPEFDGYLYQPETAKEETSELLQEEVPISDGTLTPPDYSTDPEIFHLAQEVFAGHDAKTNYSPVGGQSADPEDWVSALESDQQSSIEADTATMQSLVQQLSPQDEPQKPDPSILKAPADEDLSPHWQDVHRPVLDSLNDLTNDHGSAEGDTLNHDSPVTPFPTASMADNGATTSPPSASKAQRFQGGRKPTSMPVKLLMGALLGLIGLTASAALAIVMLTRTSNPETPSQPVVSEAPQVPVSDSEVPVSDADMPPSDPGSTSDSAILLQAVAALTVNNTGTSRFFIEQLLDQGDYEAAHAAIAAASNPQLLDPNIAFVRGRLIWQERARGSGTGSLYDAMRYWNQAIDADADNLEAWVALGFAHYDLGDYEQAIAAWENAIAIDRQSLRDSDPTIQQVADEFVINAYAGLAMAYQALSEAEQSPQQRASLQTQAQEYLAVAIGQAPEMLNPEQLALQWLWTSSLISNWQESTARLAVGEVLDNLSETSAN
jgi:hypothetical protein